MSRWGHGHESLFCTSQPFHGLWVALALQLSERFSALSSAELDYTLLFKEEDVTLSLCPGLVSLCPVYSSNYLCSLWSLKEIWLHFLPQQ